MSRRTPKTGSIEKMGNGRFRVRVQIDGERVTVTPRGGVRSQAIAQEYLDGLRTEVKLVATENEITVHEFSQRFMVRRRASVRASTFKRDERAMARVRVAFGGACVTSVDPPMIARIRNGWVEEGLADQTVRNRLNLMRVMFREAVEIGMLNSNPVAEVKLGRRSTRDEVEELEQSVLLPEEQQALLTALAGRDYLLPEVAFALFTGARLSELHWLQWGDVSDAHVTIRRSEDGAKPKGGKSRRIPLLEGARVAIELARGRHPLWVFPGILGAQRGHNKPPQGWRAACEAALGRYLNWHGLRHTFATSLVAGWWGRKWSLEEVRGLLGHRNVATTEIYAELVSDLAARAVGETNAAQAMPTVPNASPPANEPEKPGANNRTRTGDLRFTNPQGPGQVPPTSGGSVPSLGQRIAARLAEASEDQIRPGLAVCKALDQALGGDVDGCVETLAELAQGVA